MARIAGIDLPKNKRGVIGLTYIYGIGRSTAENILAEAGSDESVIYTTDARAGILDSTTSTTNIASIIPSK